MDGESKTFKKKRNPRERANIFSALTFFYTLPLFFLGYKREIVEEDLYETCSSHKSSVLSQKAINVWGSEIKNAKKSRRNPSLLKVLAKLFGWDFLFIGIGVGIEQVIAQPCRAVLLGNLVSYYGNPESDADTTFAYSLGIIGVTLLSCLNCQPYIMASYTMALKIRVALSSLVYHKIFKLSPSSIRRLSAGHIISLLSVDVNSFERIGFLLQMLLMSPLKIIISLYLMWSQIGVSSMFGTGVLIILVPVYVLLGKMLKRYRMKVSIRRDERIRLTNELIRGISVIKMYAWEEAFAEVISKLRKLEINSILKSTWIKAMFTFYETLSATCIFITIISSVVLTERYESKSVFITMNLISSISQCLTLFLPSAVFAAAEAKIALKRISAFLLSEEIDLIADSDDSDLAVTIRDGSAKCDEGNNIFMNLNVKIKKGRLTALIGTVGSGKSSLCQIICRELPLCKGKLCVNGSISCASQDPWIFSGSIRQNILFGREMEETRYKKVIECCALKSDLSIFSFNDQTIVGERGASLSGGQKARINLARCIYRDADIYLLDDPFSAVDAHVGKHIFENCIQSFLNGKTIILVTHQLQYLTRVDNVIALDNGAVHIQSQEDETKFDLSKYLRQDESVELDSIGEPNNTTPMISKNIEENRSLGFISFHTYKKYLLASNSYLLVIVTIILFICAEFGIISSFYFIGYWINVEEKRKVENNPLGINVYVYIYCAIATVTVALSILRLVAFIKLTMSSSKSLHDSMFTRLLHSKLHFFTLNTSGRILNRFSKDLLSIDEALPSMAVIAILTNLGACGLLFVICIVNTWFIIPTILIIIVLFYMRRFYLSTNLSILRVESVVRSPLYGHVQSTLQGLSTIRTFEVQETLIKEFNHHLDTHTSALHMSYTVSRAFGYWIDLLSFLFISTTVIFYMIKKETYGGNVGIVITQAVNLIGLLPWGIRHLTDVENCMVSVERVLEYSSMAKERNLKTAPSLKLSPTWPERGRIRFKQVYFRYTSTAPFVLKNLNFVIEPLQKIGIVGRTGAGKSSIIAALFQLADVKGSIEIDGIDIKTIGLHDLRKKISIIPQDPVLFSGTFRSNLDPFEEFGDSILWNALEDVKLKEIINSLPLGLHSVISHDGSNLSVGQRQLLCLARAIVRSNRVLILDEATANDLETDEVIQKTISTKFKNCTVLTIAHRINTIINYDKILVMSSGELVEFDHPYKLLENKNGAFYSMVHK